MKYIFHIDMNAFFATVEEILNPKLKNKPFAVCGKTTRSVISSPNYIARSYGVKAAMPLFMARQKCKNLTIVTHHFDQYEHYSDLFIHFIREKLSNKIEIMSIDECFVDVTHLCHSVDDAIKLAKRTQKQLYDKIGLKSSIGISYNKFLAKMASDIKKPMGICTIFTKKDLQTKIWPLPIDALLFIGKSSAQLLRQEKIEKIGDIANPKNNAILKECLNKNWQEHFLHANGYGSDELDYSNNEYKSISCSETFVTDTIDQDEIKSKIQSLTVQCVSRLNENKMMTKTLSIYVKLKNNELHSKSFTLKKYTDDLTTIMNKVNELFIENFANIIVRLVGIALTNLTKKVSERKSPLFDDYKKTAKNRNSLNDIIKKINNQSNLDIIGFANKLLKK